MSRRVTALNNNGVQSLYRGNFVEATLAFRHAIECVKNQVYTFDCNYYVSCPQEQEQQLPLFRSAVDCLDESNVLQISPHNMFDVFQNAFLLPKVESIVHFQTEFSIVLFYHLGLAHHLAGLTRRTENAKQHLQEAQRYYKISLSILRSTDTLKFDISCYPLMLGLMTNLGHLFSHCWRLDDAMSCRSRVEELLDSGASLGLSLEEQDFFLTTLASGEAAQTLVMAPAA